MGAHVALMHHPSYTVLVLTSILITLHCKFLYELHWSFGLLNVFDMFLYENNNDFSDWLLGLCRVGIITALGAQQDHQGSRLSAASW